MSTSSIPVCYFPSTTLFLDKNSHFLQNFATQLPQPFIFRCFDNSDDVLQALQLNRQSENLSQWCLNDADQVNKSASGFVGETRCLDLAAIHWEVYNPQRFNECTVIVINSLGSAENTLAFCRQIQNHAIKKILLVDKDEAALIDEVVNAGLIDLCLNKQDPNINSLLVNGIKHLQNLYFLTMSQTISKMLITKLSECLYDPAFIDLFYQLSQQEHIVEYYLMEDSGSFLMLDILGKPSCLVIKRQEDLLQHYEMGKKSNAPITLLEEIKSGKRIPSFLSSHNYYQSEWTDWVNYIHKADILIGKETYYYAHVKDLLGLDVHADRILSYKDYIEQFKD